MLVDCPGSKVRSIIVVLLFGLMTVFRTEGMKRVSLLEIYWISTGILNSDIATISIDYSCPTNPGSNKTEQGLGFMVPGNTWYV